MIIRDADIALKGGRIAASWVAGECCDYLHLTEPFLYLVLMHLGVGGKFFGLLNASAMSFFRICTQEVRVAPRPAAPEPGGPDVDSLAERTFLILLSFVFNLEDLKKQNVIDWRTIIDFLIRPPPIPWQGNGAPRSPTSIDDIVAHVQNLQGVPTDKGVIPLFPRTGFPVSPPLFRAALQKLKALILHLPEDPAVPLYCYSPIPALSQVVLTPSPLEVDWIFCPPPPVVEDLPVGATTEAVKQRFAEFLSVVSDKVTDFFFAPPAEGARSRGTLFGFMKEIPPEAPDMFLFREREAKEHLQEYCAFVRTRLELALDILE
jgi:hypothetical protein